MSIIKLTIDNEEVMVKMYDNPTSKNFLTLLPLSLEFEDYAGTEKISNLPKRLSTENAPSGSKPSGPCSINIVRELEGVQYKLHPALFISLSLICFVYLIKKRCRSYLRFSTLAPV